MILCKGKLLTTSVQAFFHLDNIAVEKHDKRLRILAHQNDPPSEKAGLERP